MNKKQEGALAQEAVSILTQAVGDSFYGRAVLLFSGGRDSSAVAAAYGKAFPENQLYLLFIDNGLLSRIESTGRQAKIIQNLFPETDIQFHTRRVSQMMRVAGMQEIENDFKEHNFSSLLICVACKLIMNFAAIRFANELGIDFILDGYAKRQSHYPEQTETFINFVKNLFLQNNIQYLSPLYHFLSDKEKVNKSLKELGVYTLKQEPVCMWADSFSEAKDKKFENVLKKCLSEFKKIKIKLSKDFQNPYFQYRALLV